MNTKKMFNKLTKKQLYTYNIYFFTYFFAVGTLLPWIPIYLSEIALLSNDKIGLILSIISLVSIIFQPIWGIVNDKLHLDKQIVYLGIIMVNIFVVLIFLSTNFYIIALFTFLFGLFSCGIGPIQDSLTVIYTKKYCFKYGDVRIWGSIGYAVATVISGYFIKNYGYDSILMLASLFFLVSFFAFIRIKQVKNPLINKNIKQQINLFKVLKNKVFIIFLIFASLSIGVLSAMGNFTALRLMELGGSTTQIGFITALTVFMEIITMLYVIKVNTRISEYKLLIISILIQIPFLLVYIYSSNLYLLVYILLLRGISSGMFITVMVNFISSLLPNDQTLSGLILYSAISLNLTGYLTNTISGFIIAWFSYKVLFTTILCLVLFSLVLASILYKTKEQVVDRI